MFRTKDSGRYRRLLDGVYLKTRVHGEKSLMGEFRLDPGGPDPIPRPSP